MVSGGRIGGPFLNLIPAETRETVAKEVAPEVVEPLLGKPIGSVHGDGMEEASRQLFLSKDPAAYRQVDAFSLAPAAESRPDLGMQAVVCAGPFELLLAGVVDAKGAPVHLREADSSSINFDPAGNPVVGLWDDGPLEVKSPERQSSARPSLGSLVETGCTSEQLEVLTPRAVASVSTASGACWSLDGDTVGALKLPREPDESDQGYVGRALVVAKEWVAADPEFRCLAVRRGTGDELLFQRMDASSSKNLNDAPAELEYQLRDGVEAIVTLKGPILINGALQFSWAERSRFAAKTTPPRRDWSSIRGQIEQRLGYSRGRFAEAQAVHDVDSERLEKAKGKAERGGLFAGKARERLEQAEWELGKSSGKLKAAQAELAQLEKESLRLLAHL